MSDNGTTAIDLVFGPAIDELAAALCKAQGLFSAAKKDGKNPHFRSTFATLESVIDAVREPLHECGLAFIQPTVYHPEGLGLVTMLLHRSGQYIRSTMVLPADTQKGRTEVQACGSTITYMRRYALLAMLGIPTEDDDGNTAGPRTGDRQATQPDHGAGDGTKLVTKAQIGKFHALVHKLGLTREQVQKGLDSRGYHGSGFADLTKSQGSEVLDSLDEQVNNANAEQG